MTAAVTAAVTAGERPGPPFSARPSVTVARASTSPGGCVEADPGLALTLHHNGLRCPLRLIEQLNDRGLGAVPADHVFARRSARLRRAQLMGVGEGDPVLVPVSVPVIMRSGT